MTLSSKCYSRIAVSVAAALAGGLVSSLSTANAQAAPPFQELIGQSANSPRILAADAEIRRAQGLALQAGAMPNPTIGVTSENFSGSNAYKNFDQAENTLQLSLPIELGGKRDARIDAGNAELVASRARAADGRAEYIYDLAIAYALAEASDLRVDRAVNEVEDATSDMRVARALVEAGREAELRIQQSATSLGAAQAELDAARAAKIAAFARLSALSGAGQQYTAVGASVLTRQSADVKTAGFDALQSPAYLAALADRDAANRRVRVEQTRAAPDVTTSLGVRQFEIDNSTAVVFGLSIPLPVFDQNRGGTDAARAALDGANARLNGARLQVQADGSAARAQIEASQARVEAAVASEEAASEAYRLSRVAYENGRASLLELVNARRAAGLARSTTIEARLARAIAEAVLARLQGQVPFGGTP